MVYWGLFGLGVEKGWDVVEFCGVWVCLEGVVDLVLVCGGELGLGFDLFG